MLRCFFLLTALLIASPATAQTPAREFFGGEPLPAALNSEPIGFYSRGCMAGGVAMPPDGPYWQSMRLTRNRQWGLPILVDFLQTLARDAAAQDGWPGLLVGDMAQPRGGPMLTGHASHQIGLDADIWLTPMPSHRLSEREREDLSAAIITEPGPHDVYNERWTSAHGRVIRRAALDSRVERIFVAPGIKRALCQMFDAGDRAWLSKVRPYYGHNYHFHVRLSCPPGTRCRSQDPPPAGDGCGSDLDWWFTDEPYASSSEPPPPDRPLTMDDLPSACRTVLDAEAVAGAMTMRQAFAAGVGTGGTIAPAPVTGNAAGGAEPARLPQARPGLF